MEVEFHPLARIEAETAAEWYRERDPGTVEGFVRAMVAHAKQRPGYWSHR